MIKLIDDSKDDKLCDALIESLHGTDLANLVLWHDDIKQKILKNLESMKKYGEELDKQGVSKGKKAIELADKLAGSLNSLSNIEDVSISQKKTHILDIKLQLITELHREDNHFASHRGYKRIVANILALFTFGVAHCINKYRTDNWLFFNRTTTEEKVANCQTLLGVQSDEPINLNLK